MYFIAVNKYRFCISVIGYVNMQIIGIGNKKIYIGSLQRTATNSTTKEIAFIHIPVTPESAFLLAG